MAEQIKIPISLTGMGKLQPQISGEVDQIYSTIYAKVQKKQAALDRLLESHVRAGGAKKGKFKVPTNVEIFEGEENIGSVVLNATADLDKKNRDLNRKKQHLLRQQRNLGTVGGIDRAIKRQIDLIRELRESFKGKLIDESVVQAAEKDLKQLINRRNTLKKSLIPKEEKKTIRDTSEKFKNLLSTIRGMRKDSTVGEIDSAIKNMEGYVEQLKLVGKKAPPELLRSGRKELSGLQKKKDALVEKNRKATVKAADDAKKQDNDEMMRALQLDVTLKKQLAGINKQEAADKLQTHEESRDAQRKMRKRQIGTIKAIRKNQETIRKSEEKTERDEIKTRKEATAILEAAHEEDRREHRKRRERQAGSIKTRRQKEREWNRVNSQKIMGLASAGIGIFGQAGFPLLNIAFASMSGMKYAGIAAVATAIGEVARGLISLHQGARQAAESLGYTTSAFRIASGKYEANKAFYGGLFEAAEIRSAVAKSEALQRGGSLMKGSMALSNMWSRIKSSWAQPKNINPVYLYIQSIKDMQKDVQEMPKKTREMFAHADKQLNAYNARIEAPEGMWRRIQEAAASKGTDDRKVAMAQLEELRKIARSVEESRRRDEKGREARDYAMGEGVYF